MMTDAEKMYNIIMDFRAMIVARQQRHEEMAKRSGTSGKRANGNRAAECSTILGEMHKIIMSYDD